MNAPLDVAGIKELVIALISNTITNKYDSYLNDFYFLSYASHQILYIYLETKKACDIFWCSR